MSSGIEALKPLRLAELSCSAELPLDRLRRCRSTSGGENSPRISPRCSYATAVSGARRTVLERRASTADLGAEAVLGLREENRRLSLRVNELRTELNSFDSRLFEFETADTARQRRIMERCDEIERHLARVRAALEATDVDAIPTPRATDPLAGDNAPQLDVDGDFDCADRSTLFCDRARIASGQAIPDVSVAIMDACAAAEAKRASFAVALGRSGLEAVRRWRLGGSKLDGDAFENDAIVDSLPECATESEQRVAQIREELKALQENREQKAARVTELLYLSRQIGPRSLAFEAVIAQRVLTVVFGAARRPEYTALCRLSPHMVIDASVASNVLFFAHGLTNFDTLAHLGRAAFSTFVLRARIAAFDEHMTADAYCRAAVDHAPLWLDTFFLVDEITALLPYSWQSLAKSDAERAPGVERKRKALPFALIGMFEFMNSLVCARWLQRLLYEHYSRSLAPPPPETPAKSPQLPRSSTIRRKRAKQ